LQIFASSELRAADSRSSMAPATSRLGPVKSPAESEPAAPHPVARPAAASSSAREREAGTPGAYLLLWGMTEQPDAGAVPRGRHAPPLEVRLSVQRRRLFGAAAAVFARVGYAEASAEAISREAGMSKATFYEHFSNKEECILGLFDEAATEVMRAMAGEASAGLGGNPDDYEERVRGGVRAFLEILTEYPESAQTLLVEIIGAGPRAAERRDAILDLFAEGLLRDNARMAERFGAPRFASKDDAFAVVGATVELVSRQLRTGVPEDIAALEPVIERLVFGLLASPR
jgi:AcrR family transcriptional regulator